ncbi:helix-turn-helix domain-containing protein [Streptomyces sp. NPDC020996]|uniref:helix-turn-helix domain-containing protein n=1 Tax=Streptomyces sp. NPDC020996 TaxID=3154791 RepID=UPI0033C76041
MSTLTAWAHANPVITAAGAALLLLTALTLPLLRSRRTRTSARTPAAVIVAALGALACTAYSGDTSWRFAEHELGMASVKERSALFLAAELALFACALMARQNLRERGTPGAPGTLVWFITGVQVIPAYSESGIVGGTVRAVVGPVLAALLWHLAMGIELRHARPDAASASLPSLLAREARERLLSRLGLAVRDRTAEQITRDRATLKAVALAAKLADMKDGARGRARVARRLSVAVGTAQAGADDEQRAKLLDLLAARRHASALATIDLPSPWQDAQDAPEDDQDTQDAPASPSVPPFPRPVPPGARLLPIVARPAPAEPTGQDAQDAPEDDQDADDGPPPEPPLMTTADVADHYGIKPSTVRNWVAAGRIPVHSKDLAGRNLFHPDQLPRGALVPA